MVKTEREESKRPSGTYPWQDDRREKIQQIYHELRDKILENQIRNTESSMTGSVSAAVSWSGRFRKIK